MTTINVDAQDLERFKHARMRYELATHKENFSHNDFFKIMVNYWESAHPEQVEKIHESKESKKRR